MNVSAFTPLCNRVLIQRIAKPEKIGSIYLPDQAKEKPEEASVIALGIGKDKDGKDVEFIVKVGDQVMVSRWMGTDITMDGNEFAVVKESEIMGIIE
jgi:chaperonin GroES